MYKKQDAQGLFNAEHAKRYRQDEEIGMHYGSRRHYCNLLLRILQPFDSRISVLDIGCGTGRYFHCLRNVHLLIGLDISMDMLNQARKPIYSDQIDIDQVSLICGDVHSIAFPPNSIDFIYSIGTLGEYTHIDAALLGSLHSILAPGGRLFVTIVSTTSRIQAREHKQTGLVVRILRKAFPYLPHFIRSSINQLLGSHYLTRSQLGKLLCNSPFKRWEITEYSHPKGSGWQGTHFDCLAQK